MENVIKFKVLASNELSDEFIGKIKELGIDYYRPAKNIRSPFWIVYMAKADLNLLRTSYEREIIVDTEDGMWQLAEQFFPVRPKQRTVWGTYGV